MLMMEINIDEYISEEEKKEIAIEAFRDRINKAFGGSEYDQSGKEADRVMKNAISHWLSQEIEKVMTDEYRETIKTKTIEAINDKSYDYEVFQKPDVWDRTKYSAYKIIQETVKNNKDTIEKFVIESIEEKLRSK